MFIKNIYHIDTHQFGMRRVTSSFLYWDGNNCILMDVGTSDNVRNLLKYLKKNQIPIDKVTGIILTHYHFDHGGGALKLWRKINKKNPDFKIYTPQDTHDLLQNAEEHLRGAKTTFGDFVGTMDPVPEEAYEIVKKDEDLPFKLEEDYKIRLISTPGHTYDHCSPTVFKNDKAVFVYAGEAAGTLFHGSKLVSLPTSMPPNFNYNLYMKSLEKIIKLNSESIGFCHFGSIINDNQQNAQNSDVLTYLNEHKSYIQKFRSRIIELYKQNPSTKYIIENMGSEIWEERVDPIFHKYGTSINFFKNLQLAITYGMMIDLGFRKPKYEKNVATKVAK